MAETSYSWTNTDVRDLSRVFEALKKNTPSFLQLVPISGTAKNKKHEWMDQALSPTSTLLNDGSGISASDTSLTVDSTTGFLAGDIIWFEDSSLFDLAKIVSIDSGTAMTVSRGYGGSTAAAHSDDCKITLHSRPKLESTDPSATDADEPTVYYNVTQILRRDNKVSKTAQNISYYSTLDLIATGMQQKMQEIYWEMDKMLISGARYDPGSAAAARTAGGLLWFISTYAPAAMKVDASGVTLTTALINNVVEEIIKAGGTVDTLVMSTAQARAVAALNSLTSNVLINVPQMTTSAGIPAPTKFFGDLPGIITNVVIDTNMPDDKIFITDVKRLKVVPLSGRAIQTTDSTPPGGDYIQRTVLGEYTVEVHNPAESHGLIYNLG